MLQDASPVVINHGDLQLSKTNLQEDLNSLYQNLGYVSNSPISYDSIQLEPLVWEDSVTLDLLSPRGFHLGGSISRSFSHCLILGFVPMSFFRILPRLLFLMPPLLLGCLLFRCIQTYLMIRCILQSNIVRDHFTS